MNRNWGPKRRVAARGIPGQSQTHCDLGAETLRVSKMIMRRPGSRGDEAFRLFTPNPKRNKNHE